MSFTVFLIVLGVNIMLAQLAGEASSQVPYWVSGVLVPSLIGFVSCVVGGIATFLGGVRLLKKTELYRRAALWEPRAERLWHERRVEYGKAIPFVYNAGYTAAIWKPDTEPDGLAKTSSEFAECYSCEMLICSRNVEAAMREIGLKLAEYSTRKTSSANWPVLARQVVNAMRHDLGIDPLDEKASDIFTLSSRH